MERLTERQERVLRFIFEFVRDNGIPPTIREIMRGLGFSSPRPVQDHLKILQRKGYLTVRNKMLRGIELSRQFMNIPVLGRVGAGRVIADTDIEGYIDISKITTPSDDLFGLRVKGNSMYRAGIRDGDIVIVRRQQSVNPGELIVVIKDGEALIRWLRKDEKGFLLQADDLEGKYPVEVLTDDFSVIGKVVILLRDYAYPIISSYS